MASADADYEWFSEHYKNWIQNPTGPWMKDEESSFCLSDGRPFSLFWRRHHCRKCGRLICQACSTRPPFNGTAPLDHGCPERVCIQCAEEYWNLARSIARDALLTQPVRPSPASPPSSQ